MWFLEWREWRQAGLTEQRSLPAPCSGRITGWCYSGPVMPNGSALIGPTLFIFFLCKLWTMPWSTD
ncbi:hypothetical protein PHJA_001381500 [Phtheirospermum japonicum]|uniref:Uncharacterized protein n=1 Tax=Phtheirospermum japonicum TaxID=374723 RepID=A0A830C7M3_9LAMI|nr:hypothetical protein PHJA_001381500 [Phtheirospermum japonicum]